MSEPTLFDHLAPAIEASRLAGITREASRRNVYRDPAPERSKVAPFDQLEPVGRNADHQRIYRGMGGVWIGLHGVDRPLEFHASENEERDLLEAREWARIRALHPLREDAEDGE